MPVVLPQRITKNLVTILKKHHPLWMSIHFTHPNELTPEVTEIDLPASPMPAFRWAARPCC